MKHAPSFRWTRRPILAVVAFILLTSALAANAQPLQKSVFDVDPGNTKLTGQSFVYRLTYSCNNTLTDCIGAEVIDLLPPEVQFLGTVPATPGGDVEAIEVTPNYMGTGRTRVRFDMVDPLTAGNSGDLLITVRFPNGTTPDGTVATNTADGVNLETVPGTVTTPPVDVTAVASVQVALTKTLLNTPLIDGVTRYRLRFRVGSNPGTLSIEDFSVTDTLPPDTIFQGATPAADCEPGCVGTVVPSITWSGPFAANPNTNSDLFVEVTYPDPPYSEGDMVTNRFTVDGTPVGESPTNFGVGEVTHPLEIFTPSPGGFLNKTLSGPSPVAIDQEVVFRIDVRNAGNVPLEDFVLIDNVPPQLAIERVGSGSFGNPPATISVDYETNLSAGFVNLGSTPGNVFEGYDIPALAPGEYVTRLRWDFGTAPANMSAPNSTRPFVVGRVIDPDNDGDPVEIGDFVTNCVDLTAVYDPGGANTPISITDRCRSVQVGPDVVRLNPAKDTTTGGGPYNPGQTVGWRLRLISSSLSSDPLPLEELVVVDWLPVDFVYTDGTWTYNDLGTGLPAPQSFEEIPNFAGTGRTVLRWTWDAGSGDLAPGQEIRIEFDSTVRDGADFGSLGNPLYMLHNDPSLATLCTNSSTQVDTLDFDGDGDTTETTCRNTQFVNIAGIAQLISSKEVQGLCDGGFGTSSSGTLIGGSIEYLLTVENAGTVPMEDFVLIDILPFLGDTGVLDTSPRLSDWTPLLTEPITPPAGTTIFYSTSGDPCRGEVGGITTGCDDPEWTTVAPDPISSVRSFKIEFGDRVVNPGDFLQFQFRLTTPAEAAQGGEAFNSFAYLAERSDGLGSLSAEPNKVGVDIGPCPAAELGDYVWVDSDGDGTQNDGETGLNGVYVELFQTGADGVPRTFDDVLVATTLTSDDVDGNPGWYLFPGLAPDAYYVRFDPPPTYAVTMRDVGDDTLDSDADPVTACTPVVDLAADTSNLTLDLGLLPPQPAAIGNYVWFDLDADGIQDESPFLGVNGVAVRLYIDDGDGVPEPGGDDGDAVATTATDDDVYGRPGYYLFDLLTPDLPYFVEFVLPASATGFTAQDQGADDAVDSDADTTTGLTTPRTPGPGEAILTLDAGLTAPTGDLLLGDQVWCDDDNDGVFEPEDGEEGVDGVTLRLYVDANGDGEPTLDEYLRTTETFTAGGFAGRYEFGGLGADDYIVVVDLDNFSGSGELSGKVTSTGNDPAPDPDDDVNGDDNGTDVGAVLASRAVTLEDDGEPTTDDGDPDTNLTVDFGFTDAAVTVPEYDYGDAPDVIAGSGPSDYRTTALDGGAFHLQGQAGSPYLGDCVDADSGVAQDVAALGDDLSAFGLLTGTCAVPGDDEDGVIFDGQLLAGSVASIDVTAAAGTSDCVLNAWLDWNRDGVFGDDPSEVIADDLTITSGSTVTLTPAVPLTTSPGTLYGRFRCSSAGGLGSIGPAADGEVEDHATSVLGTDFGDAPDSYGTLLPTGAVHRVSSVAPLFLGDCVDSEGDGQPNASADGDDVAAGGTFVGLCAGDDEDGVVFDTPLVACQDATLTVTAQGTGVLDAWIDFAGDGVFDPFDRIATAEPLGAGSQSLTVTLPCAALAGATYARFRYSSAGVASATGLALDGEVEDYPVFLGASDFGDAPDSYGTTLAQNGPRHGVFADFQLGATVDSEADGQPSADALGDGADEDGVSFPGGAAGTACQTESVTVTASATGLLDAWIDFDADGAFDDPRDRIATGTVLAAGAQSLDYDVPCDVASAMTYARFRFSSAGVSTPTGIAADGEIEDYAFTVQGLDYGDAQDPTYPTLLASDGARHAVQPAANPSLGAAPDTETDGQPSAKHNGDDTSGVDDEDGVAFPAVLIPGTDGAVELTGGTTGGLVNAWIDWNADGDWTDPGEQIAVDLALGAGATQTVTFPVPVGSVAGSACARVRISSQSGLAPTGLAPDGEVEDHLAPVGVEEPSIGVNKRLLDLVEATSATVFDATFEIGLTNLGNVPLDEVNVIADMSIAFAEAAGFEILSLTSGDFTVNPAYNGDAVVDMLAMGQSLGVGESGLLEVVVRIDSGGVPGPYFCSALGLGTSPEGTPVDDMSEDGDDPDPDDDGDPTDNDTPTPLELPVSVLEIPTLGSVGLCLLALLMTLAAVTRLGGGRHGRREG